MIEDEVPPYPGYEKFFYDAKGRMDRGRVDYGDQSFSAHPLELVQEIKAELLDIPNWSFILYKRLDRLERMIAAVSALEAQGKKPTR